MDGKRVVKNRRVGTCMKKGEGIDKGVEGRSEGRAGGDRGVRNQRSYRSL